MNKEKTNDRKITEFFQNNNNIPASKIGTPIQKTTNQSELPTTKKQKKNNTNQMSKDGNNNINSKYVGISKISNEWKIHTPRKRYLISARIAERAVQYRKN